MAGSGEVVIEVHVGALGHFVDEAHLEELVDDLKHEVFRVKVLECRAYSLVYGIEGKTALRSLEFSCDEVAEFISLITNLVKILISLLLQAIEETLLFQLIHTLLQQFSGRLISFFTQSKFSFNLDDELGICQYVFRTESLFW